MNSRGLLLAEQTLKILIGLMALGFLIYFLSALYFNNVNSQKSVQAEASIGRILDVVQNGQNDYELVSDITPVGWSLFSFIGEKFPNSCVGQSCVCICDSVFFDFGDNQITECDKNGACAIVSGLGAFNKMEITNPGISVSINKTNEGVVFKQK